MTVVTPLQVVSVMIGTAGHVDHGKTSLVRSLTGFETDTMKEEKDRGMSIDLGVAPCPLPGDRLVGLIDVPGHEDFIKNMVVGAASIDVLLLVVAADDAVMPQTIEHMKIVKLLGMSEVMVAITKIDLVDAEVLELVRQDVAEFMRLSGYASAPVVCVSNVTGQGITEVKDFLGQLVEKIQRQPDARAFRMYVRHIFSKKGYGTVVTGVPLSGSVAIGDSVRIEPGGIATGLRAVQTYRRESAKAEAHISSALNLRDVDPAQLRRGMAVTAPGAYEASKRVLAWLRSEAPGTTLEHRGELRFLCGTEAIAARYRLLNTTELGHEGEAFVEFTLRRPMVIAAGDKYIVRTLSPGVTIGGGVVLSIKPGARLRSSAALTERLRAAHDAATQGEYTVSELIAGTDAVVTRAKLAVASQKGEAGVSAEAVRLVAAKQLISLTNDNWLVPSRITELSLRLYKFLKRYHRENKNTWGMKPTWAAELLGVPVQAFEQLLSHLRVDNPEITMKHSYLALSDFTPQIGVREVKLREQVLEAVKAAGTASEAMGGIKEKLAMTPAETKLVLKLLSDEGLVAVAGNTLLLRSIVEEWRQLLIHLFERHPVIDLKTFRETTGATRNVAVAVLELFDNEGITKRQGEGRILNVKQK